MHDSSLGRWLSPDPLAGKYAGISPYAYCVNNPVCYIDPDGRLAWFVIPLITAGVFAIGNLVTHAMRGDVNSFADGAKYFLQGAAVGFVLGCVYQFAPMLGETAGAIINGQ